MAATPMIDDGGAIGDGGASFEGARERDRREIGAFFTRDGRQPPRTAQVETWRIAALTPREMAHLLSALTHWEFLALLSRREKEMRLSGELEAAEKIIAEVAARFGYSPEELRQYDRTPRLVWARQLAMARVRKETHLSTTRIGALFNRDHTTVLAACRAVAARKRRSLGAATPENAATGAAGGKNGDF